jgi:hypothetical protein
MNPFLFRKLLFWLVLILTSIPMYGKEHKVAVTYESNPGRFGDQLMGYLHAKWVSHAYGIPMLYKPFFHSKAFMLHEKETFWTEEIESEFDEIIRYTKEEDLLLALNRSVLFVVPFFTGIADDHIMNPHWISFPIGWEDRGFRKKLKELFQPRPWVHNYTDFILPRDKEKLSVALHIRKGSGSDPSDPHITWPLRFCPNSYYVECLQKLCGLFPGRSIEAFVFTDDHYPKKIIANLQKELQGFPIEFRSRENGYHPEVHHLEDFFSMMNFDCLIRSASNFSLVPSVASDQLVVMSPKHFVWAVVPAGEHYQAENYIDRIDVYIKPSEP